jgi:hypothetical protein
MAQHLQAARHVTDAIGKWHLGSEAQFHPLSRGFDESHRAEPWLLYLAFNARHTPLEAPPEWLARVVAPQKGRSVSSASTETRAAVSAAKSSMQ